MTIPRHDFVALSSGKAKYILTFRLVVILTACGCHCITTSFLRLKLSISILIKILELNPLSNRIRKFLKFALPFRVFMHTYRLGDKWIFIFLVYL